jgi:hypothetical protein
LWWWLFEGFFFPRDVMLVQLRYLSHYSV